MRVKFSIRSQNTDLYTNYFKNDWQCYHKNVTKWKKCDKKYLPFMFAKADGETVTKRDRTLDLLDKF